MATPGPIPIAVQANIQNIMTTTNYNDIIVGYSPVLLTFSIIIITAFSQTTQGLTFMGFLLLFSFIRKIFVYFGGAPTPIPNCINFPVIQYDNDGFNVFYIIFLFGYLVAPMIPPLSMIPMNVLLVTILGAYMCYIIIYSSYNCVNWGYITFNLIYAIGAVAATIFIMISSNLQSQLFLYVGASDAVKCSMPSNQSFKCSVYKNGELQSNTVI
jgi:hypothetical protein